MRLLLLALMLFCLDSQAVDSDKWQHFGVSFGLTTACTAAINGGFKLEGSDMWGGRLVCGTMVGMMGIITEVNDVVNSRTSMMDSGDLQANALGILSSALLTWTFNF